MLKKNFSKGLALAVMLGVSNFAYAAPATYDFSEVVVSASRMDLNLKELPQSAEVITKEEIKQIGATNVKEALRLSPSLVLSEAAGVGDILRLRGSDDVMILVNGRQLANETNDDYRLNRINVQNVERIEILRGPSGALYGSSAMGGVINIVTKEVEDEGATVGVATGSREMSNYYRFDTGRMGKLAASFDANFTKVRPFKWEDAGMSKMSGPKQLFNLDIDYKMDANNNLKLITEYSNEDLTYVSAGMGPGSRESVKNYDAERKSATLAYDGKSAKSNYSMDITFSNLDRGAGDDRDFWDVDVRNTVRSTDKFSLTYGGEFSRDEGFQEVRGEDVKMGIEQWSGYVYGEYRPSEKFLIVPSIRFDDHEEFGDHTSPSIGLTYFADPSSRIKVSYGSGYKTPTIEQLYAGGPFFGGMATWLPNENLKPEKSNGIEIAWEKEFDDRTASKLTYFKNEKEDAIVKEESGRDIQVRPGMFIKEFMQYVNVDEASYEGVEYSLSHDLGNGFTAGLEYEYLDAKDKSDNSRLMYNARNTYTVKLQWVEPEQQEWSVTMWNRWLSDYRTVDNKLDGAEVNRSINTFNFVVNKSWEDNKYNAFVGIDNLFDKDSYAMRYSGRVWRVGAEVRF